MYIYIYISLFRQKFGNMTTESPAAVENEKTENVEDEKKSNRSSEDRNSPLGKSVKLSSSMENKMPMNAPPPRLFTVSNPAADTRCMRRIIAEDPEWSLATVPLLVDLVIKHIVDNFECK